MNQSVINEIKNINEVIDDNISEKDYLGRGLLSQNILSQLRNLVEDFIVLHYNKKYKKNLGVSFQDKKTAYNYGTEKFVNPGFLVGFIPRKRIECQRVCSLIAR